MPSAVFLLSRPVRWRNAAEMWVRDALGASVLCPTQVESHWCCMFRLSSVGGYSYIRSGGEHQRCSQPAQGSLLSVLDDFLVKWFSPTLFPSKLFRPPGGRLGGIACSFPFARSARGFGFGRAWGLDCLRMLELAESRGWAGVRHAYSIRFIEAVSLNRITPTATWKISCNTHEHISQDSMYAPACRLPNRLFHHHDLTSHLPQITREQAHGSRVRFAASTEESFGREVCGDLGRPGVTCVRPFGLRSGMEIWLKSRPSQH